MRTETDWQAEAKGLLKAEMKRRAITYDQLAVKLGDIGVKADSHVLRNKVSRGGFSAAFFLQCLSAIGCHTLRLEES